MGKCILLNGSPRAPRSNSKRYAQMVRSCLEDDAEYYDLIRSDFEALCGKVEQARDMLLIFPLYADAVPLPVLSFLKALERNPPKSKPTVSVLINCGFLEPQQNDIAVEMVRLFCKQNGFPFGSVLKIGSGEAILDSPFRFLAAKHIRRFARSVVHREHRSLAVTMPLTKRLFVTASSRYWINYGKKYGVTKKQMETMAIEGETG